MNLDMTEIFALLNNQENNVVVLTIFWGLCVLVILLRALVCAGYQAQIVSFNLNAKDVASRSEIKDTGCGLLNRVVKEYVKTAEKGISGVNAGDIVCKHVRRLHFLGWSYESIELFLSGFSQGVVLIGILFAVVFADYQSAYAVSAVAAFVILRLMECVMDIRLVKLRLIEALTEYVSREVGQFYAGDLGSVVLRLKNDLSASVLHQSETVLKYIDKMSDIAKTLESQNESRQISDRALGEQLAYIEKNQHMLEESMSGYEQSLERITQKLGDGLGGMTEFHIQEAMRAVSDKLQDNVKQIVTSNFDMLAKLGQMFENMNELSKSETQAILRITEQLESEIEQAR